MPRFAGDTLRITCDWPEPRPRDELDRIAAAIRDAHARLVEAPSGAVADARREENGVGG